MKKWSFSILIGMLISDILYRFFFSIVQSAPYAYLKRHFKSLRSLRGVDYCQSTSLGITVTGSTDLDEFNYCELLTHTVAIVSPPPTVPIDLRKTP